MMNKKLIALLIAITTAGIISAHYRDYRDYRDYDDENCYEDRHGHLRCPGGIVRKPVRATVGAAEDVAEGAVHATGDVVEGTARAITAPFRP